MKIVKDEMTINYPVLLPDTLKWNEEEEYKKRAQKVIDEKLTENLIIEELSEIGYPNTYAITNNTSVYMSVMKEGKGSCTCESFTYQSEDIPCKHLIVLMQAIEAGTVIPVTDKTKELVLYAKEQYENTLAQNKHTTPAPKQTDTLKTMPSPPAEIKPQPQNKPTPYKTSGMPKVKPSDHDLDRAITQKKAEKAIRDQGEMYKVGSVQRPDSQLTRQIANKYKINTEILEAVQTDEYCKVIVRGHLDDQFTDAVVITYFKQEQQKQVFETAMKYPNIITGWEGIQPIINPTAQIKKYDGTITTAAEHILTHYYQMVSFAPRINTTKAETIVFNKLLNKLLNQKFQEKYEIEDETKEREEVQKSINEQKHGRS